MIMINLKVFPLNSPVFPCFLRKMDWFLVASGSYGRPYQGIKEAVSIPKPHSPSFLRPIALGGWIVVLLFVSTAFAKLHAQCFLDRHNTTWFDGWLSCETSMNPNAARGESHWIMYDLNESYGLFKVHIWNTNAPEYLNSGMQDIAMDISQDGVNWTSVGEFQLPRADGTSTYEGVDLLDLGGIGARYVLITGLTNHGGDCFGLSEIRIDVAEEEEEVITAIQDLQRTPGCLSARIFPNPVTENSQAFISSTCGTSSPIWYDIQDLSGKTIRSGQINLLGQEATLALHTVPLVSGMYVLLLRQGDVQKRIKMVKAQ